MSFEIRNERKANRKPEVEKRSESESEEEAKHENDLVEHLYIPSLSFPPRPFGETLKVDKRAIERTYWVLRCGLPSPHDESNAWGNERRAYFSRPPRSKERMAGECAENRRIQRERTVRGRGRKESKRKRKALEMFYIYDCIDNIGSNIFRSFHFPCSFVVRFVIILYEWKSGNWKRSTKGRDGKSYLDSFAFGSVCSMNNYAQHADLASVRLETASRLPTTFSSSF